jgi:hypothetical protein
LLLSYVLFSAIGGQRFATVLLMRTPKLWRVH